MTVSLNLPEAVLKKLEDRAARSNVAVEVLVEQILTSSVDDGDAEFEAAMVEVFEKYAPAFKALAEGAP